TFRDALFVNAENLTKQLDMLPGYPLSAASSAMPLRSCATYVSLVLLQDSSCSGRTVRTRMDSDEHSTFAQLGIEVAGLLLWNPGVTQRFLQVARVLCVLVLPKPTGQLVPKFAYFALLVRRGNPNFPVAVDANFQVPQHAPREWSKFLNYPVRFRIEDASHCCHY